MKIGQYGYGGMKRGERRRQWRKRAKPSMTEMIEVSRSDWTIGSTAADIPAIRNTLIFYAAHLAMSAAKPPQLIMLSDDRRNRELAQTEGLLAVSTREYVDGLVPVEREKLVDLVVGGVDALGDGEKRGRRIYDEVSSILQASTRKFANLVSIYHKMI